MQLFSWLGGSHLSISFAQSSFSHYIKRSLNVISTLGERKKKNMISRRKYTPWCKSWNESRLQWRPCRSMYTLIWFETSVCARILNEISRLRSPHLLIVSFLLNHSPAFTDPLWLFWDRVHSNVVCGSLYILNTVFIFAWSLFTCPCLLCLSIHTQKHSIISRHFLSPSAKSQPTFFSVCTMATAVAWRHIGANSSVRLHFLFFF